MGTIGRREINTKRVEYVVSTHPDWGTTHNEINQAIHSATQEYHKLTGGVMGAPLPDDVIHIIPGNGEIIVFFVLGDKK